jgi:CRP-like cAMP-binding protein
MMEEHFVYGQPLYNNGDPIDKIYVVQSGSFKLCKKISKRSFAGLEHCGYRRVVDDRKKAEYLVVHRGEVLGDC